MLDEIEWQQEEEVARSSSMQAGEGGPLAPGVEEAGHSLWHGTQLQSLLETYPHVNQTNRF